MAGGAHGGSSGLGRWVEAAEYEWWAADLAALEAADRSVHADKRGVIVNLGDDAVNAVQVAGTGVVVDLHAVADRQHRERFQGANGVEQLVAGVDGFGDCDQMRVKLTGGDLAIWPNSNRSGSGALAARGGGAGRAAGGRYGCWRRRERLLTP